MTAFAVVGVSAWRVSRGPVRYWKTALAVDGGLSVVELVYRLQPERHAHFPVEGSSGLVRMVTVPSCRESCSQSFPVHRCRLRLVSADSSCPSGAHRQ